MEDRAVDVKLNKAAMVQLRNSPEIIRMMVGRATNIARKADEAMVGKRIKARIQVLSEGATENHKVLEPERGKDRARVAVVTATGAAMRSEATKRTLTRAIRAGALNEGSFDRPGGSG